MSLFDALEALLEEHDRVGSPLRDRLVPGTPPDQTEAAIRGLGLTPTPELLDLFAWHAVRDMPGEDARITWFWPASPLRLDEAVSSYRQSMQLGGVTPEELIEHLAASGPGSTLTGFWRSDWFPILSGEPEEYAAVCALNGEHLVESRVWRQNWHPHDSFQSAQIAPSLTSFVDRIVELFRAGAYVWDAEQRDIATVDEVFEALDLGMTGRPWQ
jgi:hypothetical protein